MGLVEEPVVGKRDNFNRSWAIVHFQSANHLEWFGNGYGKELVADGYEPLVKEVRPTQWIRNTGLGKMPVGECILFSESHEKKQRRQKSLHQDVVPKVAPPKYPGGATQDSGPRLPNPQVRLLVRLQASQVRLQAGQRL